MVADWPRDWSSDRRRAHWIIRLEVVYLFPIDFGVKANMLLDQYSGLSASRHLLVC